MIDQHRGGDLICCLLPTFLITFSKDDRQHLKMVMINRIFRFTNPMTMESIEGVCEHYDYKWMIALTFSGFPKSAALIIAVRTCCCSRFAFFVEIVEVPLIMLLVKGGDLHSFHPKRLNSSQESWLS